MNAVYYSCDKTVLLACCGDKISEHSSSLADSGKSDKSLSEVHNSDTATKSAVGTECLPMAVEAENHVTLPKVLSAPRRHFTCFLRTKSDVAIGNSRTSSQLSSVADAANKPLALTPQTLCGSLQDKNRMQKEQGVSGVKLKRRICEVVQSNSTSTQNIEVVARNVSDECDDSVESSNFQQKMLKLSKNNDRDSCEQLLPYLQSPAKSSDTFQPMSAVYRSDRLVGSTDTSVASAVTAQTVPARVHVNVNTLEMTRCAVVPLSTSNIVNVNRLCAVTGQNNAPIRRRVIVIKRHQNLPVTTTDKQHGIF